VPITALNSKIDPAPKSNNEYEVNPIINGEGIKNNAIINLKTLSALF
tara:strand:- start:255 stop:395 length:141 start_codon:yes stop_codon:yes gene_type:complete